MPTFAAGSSDSRNQKLFENLAVKVDTTKKHRE